MNLIAVGFVDTPLPSSDLGGHHAGRAASNCGRRFRSGASSPRPDVAALAVHLMANTAVTGATIEIDGGQQLVER